MVNKFNKFYIANLLILSSIIIIVISIGVVHDEGGGCGGGSDISSISEDQNSDREIINYGEYEMGKSCQQIGNPARQMLSDNIGLIVKAYMFCEDVDGIKFSIEYFGNSPESINDYLRQHLKSIAIKYDSYGIYWPQPDEYIYEENKELPEKNIFEKTHSYEELGSHEAHIYYRDERGEHIIPVNISVK